METKKRNVHMVQHTHWDREWYFTSDDSRAILNYDLRFVINYLENHDDKFSFDGQSSIIEDFLLYEPEWKERFKKVVKDKKLYVGPFYTQTDNVNPHGESIVRNIEFGKHIANDMGHSMNVGYLPDSFGHNNQTPQILKMNGINNVSFYRGLDPKDTNDQIYFDYEGQDGTTILGHWQTHYCTHWDAFQYTTEAFDKYIVEDYETPGKFHPSVKSYAKRTSGLSIGIPVGSDQRPFRKEVKEILKDLNKKYEEFNFIASDYETLLNEVAKEIKEKNIKLPLVTGELRQSLTGRVHRSVSSSRMDIKQKHFKLEDSLINLLEPLSIMCLVNEITVPWKMIHHVWKELFKSSAHDSYGTTNSDVVNRKNENRLVNAQRTADGLIALLSKSYSLKILDKKDNNGNTLVVFNLTNKIYSGIYEINTTVKKGHEKSKFKIYDGDTEIRYSIFKRDKMGAHERDALRLVFNIQNVNPFSTKELKIKYFENSQYLLNRKNKIQNQNISVTIEKDSIIIEKNNKRYENLISLAMDPSVGDTYDHSPITFNDKKYILNNYKIIETNESTSSIKFEASGMVPSGIKNWENNKALITQTATIQLKILENKIYLKVFVTNKSLNGRMIALIKTLSDDSNWYHDQQFGIYKRNIENKYMKDWDKKDKFGYKWPEYPTNLSPMQSFISNNDSTLTVYVKGSKEHEMIKFDGKNNFAITLYRAFDVFGKKEFTYRPGRASGSQCAAPDCQLLGDELEYTFLIDISKTDISQQFNNSKQLMSKAFYIPFEWGLERSVLIWNRSPGYFEGFSKQITDIKLPSFTKKEQFVISSIYRDIKKENKLVL